MLKLEKYGVCLRQVGLDDIETVRQWRNLPDVANYMAYREYITPEKQQHWYKGVCERGDLYFMINVDGKDIGVINLKDINLIDGDAEGGIFIVDKAFINGHISYCANLCLMDFAFECLRLRRIKAHILDENKRAIRYNLSLGFKPTDEIVNEIKRLYIQDKDSYYKASAKVKKALRLGIH